MQNELVITGQDVVDEARTWLDTPFVDQAAVKGLGCDCIGLIRGIGRDLEICDFDENEPEHKALLNYGRIPMPKRMVAGLNRWLVRVHDPEEYRRGDVLLFAIDQVPQHVAIYTDVLKGVVIHTFFQQRNVIECRYVGMRPSGVWRFPGVAHPQGEWQW